MKVKTSAAKIKNKENQDPNTAEKQAKKVGRKPL